MRPAHRLLLILIATTGINSAYCGAAELPVTVIAAPTPAKTQINLLEDEVILPPYLVRYEGGPILNVTPATKPAREAKPRELLDYGDAFRLLPRLAFQVVAKENFQWVGGGVFEGRFFGPKIAQEEIPYGFRIDRGWARVWVNEPEPGIRIETPNGEIRAQTAQFWLTVQDGETEVYILSGSIVGPGGSEAKADQFIKWKSGDTAAWTGKLWTPDSLEQKVKSVYPHLLELARRADDDWDDEMPQKTYSVLRKKGWRKASRTAPKTE